MYVNYSPIVSCLIYTRFRYFIKMAVTFFQSLRGDNGFSFLSLYLLGHSIVGRSAPCVNDPKCGTRPMAGACSACLAV